jgi:glycosyltransferase involved in cell wall biosynthesis
MNKTISFAIVFIVILITSFLINKYFFKEFENDNENDNKNESDNENENLEKYQIKCKNIILSSESFGLILDARIICDKIPDLDLHLGTRNLIIETTNKKIKPEDLNFVNLDWTNFKNIPNKLLCKTKQAYNILKPKFNDKEVIYTGFTSVDRFRSNCNMDYNMFIHICGKSRYKGTLKIVEAWINHPEFPLLTIKVYEMHDSVYSEIKKMLKHKIVNNLKINKDFVSEEEMFVLYNTCGIHLCPSNVEGWGHYIAEAKSAKAVVLYTNAPCMNETFTDGVDGISIVCNTNSPIIINGLCPFYEINANDIANSVQKVLSLSLVEKQRIGNNARNSFLKNDKDFTFNFQNLIYNL